jgi:glycosyltransferase involved in cell wall biosynthesis
MKKLAIVITHPIQYYVPVFQRLSQLLTLKVFYTEGQQAINKFDTGFEQRIKWDIPLLSGYEFEFLKNISPYSGTSHFLGVINTAAVKSIQQFKPTTLLIYGWANPSHLNLIHFFHNKVSIMFRGDSRLLEGESWLKKAVKTALLNWIYNRVNTSFYVGSLNKEYFKSYGPPKMKLVYAPHAIDNARFEKDQDSGSRDLRRNFKIPQTDILILFAGKHIQIKDPTILLRAFCDLKPAHVHLLFVGSGPLTASLRLYAAAQEAGRFVHFLPFQNQSKMPTMYKACDLFCMPTKNPGETWGLAINEAMAAGRGILCSDQVGAAKDLVDDSNGAIFRAEDLADLKEKLTALLVSKATLKVLGQRSAQRIKRWSLDKQVEQIFTHV